MNSAARDVSTAADYTRLSQVSWGVYPRTMDVSGSVDDLIERSLLTAKEFAGLASGTRVVITAGQRTGTTGATNLIMVRDIP